MSQIAPLNTAASHKKKKKTKAKRKRSVVIASPPSTILSTPPNTPHEPMDFSSDFSSLPPLTLSLGAPPKLTREVTNMDSPLKKPRPSHPPAYDDATHPISFATHPLASETKLFSALNRWNEITWDQAATCPPETWLTYTREVSTYIAPKEYDAACAEAEAKGVDVDVIIAKIKEDRKSKRKKTTCKIVGHEVGSRTIRVCSIPLSGTRASTVFPAKSLSWDIPLDWSGAPRYYIIKPEHHPATKAAKKKSKKGKQ